MKKQIPIVLFLLLFLVVCGVSAFGAEVQLPEKPHGASVTEPRQVMKPTDLSLPPELTPENASKAVCGACHVFPVPDLLDRETWRTQTLPRMMIRMGLSPQSIEAHPEAALLKATGRFPSEPLVPMAVFDLIESYYTNQAPEHPVPQARRGEIHIGLAGFDVVRPKVHRLPAASTLVKISQTDRRIYVGDALAQKLEYFSAAGDFLGGLDVSNAPVALVEGREGFFLGMIGSFYPSEARLAALVKLERTNNQVEIKRVILDQLPRTVDLAFGDFNQDGREDFALCVFGNVQGRFSWYENLGGDRYREHVLLDKPGAVKCVVRDFNGDQRPDIAVLIAQESEMMMIFENLGNGKFASREVFHQHPLFGHTGFEVVDFNGDGRLDFLVTNGDNGEYPSPTKRYHGIRVYEDQGDRTYKQTFFYPLNGAFKAVARDFDGDGDLDVAAISFFPDYNKSPEESFVYLENRGNGRYSAFTFRESISGRWLTMDVGDVDGDGDIDIVLGSYIRGPSAVPKFLMKDWEATGSSFLILRNRLR